MTNKANNKNEMSAREQKATRGGLKVTNPARRKTPTWKYVDCTPGWAVDAARDIGYEVENICGTSYRC